MHLMTAPAAAVAAEAVSSARSAPVAAADSPKQRFTYQASHLPMPLLTAVFWLMASSMLQSFLFWL